MNWKKQFKREIAEKLDEKTPTIEKYESPKAENPHKYKKAVFISASACLASGLIAAVVILSLKPWETQNLLGEVLAQPDLRNVQTIDYSTNEQAVSQKSIAIYNSFYQKIIPEVFKGETASKSFSIPDAFTNVALLTYLSSLGDQDELLQLFGNPTLDELNTAVKEITLALGTPYYYQENNEKLPAGGFSLNSLWLDPELTIKSETEKYFKTCAEDYFASIYHVRPDETKLNKWLEDNVPSEYPSIPKIDMDIPDAAASILSSYFIFKHFPSQSVEGYKSQYQSKKHYLSYTLNSGETKDVDYLLSSNISASKYLGDGFKGAQGRLGLDYFLPDEGKKTSDILPAIISQDYSISPDWEVNVSVPYFKVENKVDLMAPLKTLGVSSIFNSGSLSQIVKEDLSVIEIKQFSLTKLDYEGFYGASVTVSLSEATSAEGSENVFDLVLNRPYLFTESVSAKTGKNSSVKLPVIFGQIDDPNYPKAA